MQDDPNGSGQADSASSGGNDTPSIPDVTARVLPSGRSHTAKVIETDAAHDLTWLQPEGGPVFKPRQLKHQGARNHPGGGPPPHSETGGPRV